MPAALIIAIIGLMSWPSFGDEIKCRETFGLLSPPSVMIGKRAGTFMWEGQHMELPLDEAYVLKALETGRAYMRKELRDRVSRLFNIEISTPQISGILARLRRRFVGINPDGYTVDSSFSGEILQWNGKPVASSEATGSVAESSVSHVRDTFPIAHGLEVERATRTIYWAGQSFVITQTQLAMFLSLLERSDGDPLCTAHAMMAEMRVATEETFRASMNDLIKKFIAIDPEFNFLRRGNHPIEGVGYYWFREGLDKRVQVLGLPLELGTNMVAAWWNGEPVEIDSNPYLMLHAMKTGRHPKASSEGASYIAKRTMNKINKTFQNHVGTDLIVLEQPTVYMFNPEVMARYR